MSSENIWGETERDRLAPCRGPSFPHPGVRRFFGAVQIFFFCRVIHTMFSHLLAVQIMCTRRVPAEGKSSVCLICMKYRIIILIIIIISLDNISLSYIANTSRTDACTHARAHTIILANTHTPPHPTHDRRCSLCAPNHDSVMVGRPVFDAGQTMPVAGHSYKQTRFHRGF